jgi:hypothetical protein
MFGEKKKRSCGECSACCTVMSVDMDEKGKVTKPAGVRCEHAKNGGGCAVYGSHPVDCKVFRCGWLDGAGKKKDRPDKSGVVLKPASIDSIERNELAVLMEGRPGALKSRAGKRLLRQSLANDKIVIRTKTDDSRNIIAKDSTVMNFHFKRDAKLAGIPIQFVPSRK